MSEKELDSLNVKLCFFIHWLSLLYWRMFM